MLASIVATGYLAVEPYPLTVGGRRDLPIGLASLQVKYNRGTSALLSRFCCSCSMILLF
jgi:hypothetical protein